MDGRRFTEQITLRPGARWDHPAAAAAARLVFLPPRATAGADRRVLAQSLRADIAAALGVQLDMP